MGMNIQGDLGAFISGLGSLEQDIDRIADDCLNEASPTLKDSLSSTIRSKVANGTGELAGSIAATKAKKNAYGHFVAVRPVGSGSNGVRNGEKLAYLEYGTSHSDAKPCMAEAVAKAEPQIQSTIQKRFEQECSSRLI